MTTQPAKPFTEDSIRPDDLRDEQGARFARDVARLLVHRDDFVVVPCPACRSDVRTPRFQKMGFDYVDCAACGTMYTCPRPQPGHLAEYYASSENYQYWAEVVFPATESTRRERIFQPRVARLLEILAAHGTPRELLIEVGPGFGTFCQEVQTRSAFDRVIAVEPTPELAESCRARGIEVIERPVEDVSAKQLPGPANVVVSFEVIEHLFEPEVFVRACREMLADGGVLVLTCPSVAGFDIATLGSASDAVDAEHLNYFTPSSLGHLVESHGFEVLEVSTPGELDAELVRKKVLAGEVDLSQQPFLQRVLIDEWDRLGADFQGFLATNALSSHLWLVARRRPG